MKRLLLALAPVVALSVLAAAQSPRSPYDGMIAAHAAANGVPVSLVHRVIVRESRYNPRAVGQGGAMGMMQIKLATARGMGYTGSAQGLLDADTNLTYAVRYLAGALRAAQGNHDRAVAYYASGYYYAAKRQGWAQEMRAPARNPQAQIANPFAALAFDPPQPAPAQAGRRAELQPATLPGHAVNPQQP